jgi:hypothetical protein
VPCHWVKCLMFWDAVVFTSMKSCHTLMLKGGVLSVNNGRHSPNDVLATRRTENSTVPLLKLSDSQCEAWQWRLYSSTISLCRWFIKDENKFWNVRVKERWIILPWWFIRAVNISCLHYVVYAWHNFEEFLTLLPVLQYI